MTARKLPGDLTPMAWRVLEFVALTGACRVRDIRDSMGSNVEDRHIGDALRDLGDLGLVRVVARLAGTGRAKLYETTKDGAARAAERRAG